jgi:hypothetical protein
MPANGRTTAAKNPQGDWLAIHLLHNYWLQQCQMLQQLQTIQQQAMTKQLQGMLLQARHAAATSAPRQHNLQVQCWLHSRAAAAAAVDPSVLVGGRQPVIHNTVISASCHFCDITATSLLLLLPRT